MRTNEERADAGRAALITYAHDNDKHDEPGADNLTDLLTDLQHAFPLLFDNAVRISEMHYNAEQDEEDEE